MAGRRAPDRGHGRLAAGRLAAGRLAAGRLAAGRHARAGVTDPHTLVGAYVMDAVTDADRASFEHHLAGCDSCQAEVRGLREATARLAAAAEVRPRAELREQTMQAAGQIRQLPPVTRGRPAAPAGWRRTWLPRLAVAAAAVFAVLAVGMGTVMNGAEHRLDQARGSSHAMAVVLGSPDATMLTAKVTSGGRATIVMSHQHRSLVFTASGLPALPSARSYQLWVMRPGGPRSAGLLPAGPDGRAGPMVISGLARGDRVGLTVEPAGGSARPTTRAIMMVTLSA
ncbi:MAG TPA: anti-sigma factor [Streptosporangiaceae bacterium]|nr:anti-sigma factor [Streptosporangiaceae bacterium]